MERHDEHWSDKCKATEECQCEAGDDRGLRVDRRVYAKPLNNYLFQLTKSFSTFQSPWKNIKTSHIIENTSNMANILLFLRSCGIRALRWSPLLPETLT